MKKPYTPPEMEYIQFDIADIITAASGSPVEEPSKLALYDGDVDMGNYNAENVSQQ